MPSKLKSRKLWVAIGTIVSILLSQYVGVEVSPEAIAGLAAIALTYIFSQGMVDKDVTAEQVRVAGDAGKLQLQLYARNLEQTLEGYAPPEVAGFEPEIVE